jgi:transcriptional regulator with XRE-family HTH domain
MGNAQWALLRAIREGRRWTMTELAARVDSTRMHIAALEKGEIANPGWRTVRAWARALGVGIDLIDHMESDPRYDERVADWVARAFLNGMSEAEIIDRLNQRYHAEG